MQRNCSKKEVIGGVGGVSVDRGDKKLGEIEKGEVTDGEGHIPHGIKTLFWEGGRKGGKLEGDC